MIKFFGTLDVAARTLEDIPKPFDALWDTGIERMRPEDVARMQDYLRRSRKAISDIQTVLNKFKTLNK